MITSAVLVIAFSISPSGAQESRSRLWTIVDTCIDPGRSGEGACPAPRGDGIGTLDPQCPTTTQVWARTRAYVAIRDRKMCGCPAGFVHGLVLPLVRIPGIEADHLPEDIWKFAWDVARQRIHDAASIALAVNSETQRTQDQLHIHLVQLRDGARERFPKDSTVTVPNLDHVWSAAKTLAKRKQLETYGVVVTKATHGGFTVLVEEGKALENQYTKSRCS